VHKWAIERTSNIATTLRLSILPATHRRPRFSTKASCRRPHNSATALFLFVSSTYKQESGSTLLGMPTRGDFTSNLATALGFSLLPITSPRPRCSTKAGRRRPHGSTAALSLSVLIIFKQESGQIQLGGETRGHFKHRHCPLALSPIRHPPKTPLLHRNEPLSAARQRYSSAFVGGSHLKARIRFNPARGADKGAI
jgi:hypothetical protein